MNKQRLKTVVLTTVLTAGAFLGTAAHADKTLDSILRESKAKTSAADSSQKRIDKLISQKSTLLQQFKLVNKQIDGLRVYNSQLEKQLANQLKVIGELEDSIDNVTVIERQIQPLILKMIDGLEQLIQNDVPIKKSKRMATVADLRDDQFRADISVGEKFRKVLEAYDIEAELGRKIDTYEDVVSVGGKEVTVEMIHIGRIALLYQTKDKKITGAWDQKQGAWVELGGEYATPVRDAIKIAKKQASINIVQLPILAPESAQ